MKSHVLNYNPQKNRHEITISPPSHGNHHKSSSHPAVNPSTRDPVCLVDSRDATFNNLASRASTRGVKVHLKQLASGNRVIPKYAILLHSHFPFRFSEVDDHESWLPWHFNIYTVCIYMYIYIYTYIYIL